jgi:hypothetical protein
VRHRLAPTSTSASPLTAATAEPTTLFLFDERTAPSVGVRDWTLRPRAHVALACVAAFAHFCCVRTSTTSARRLVLDDRANATLDAALDRVGLLERVLVGYALERVPVAGHARARLLIEAALVAALPVAERRGDGARLHALVARVRTHERPDVAAFRAPLAAERALATTTASAEPADVTTSREPPRWTRAPSPFDRPATRTGTASPFIG